MKIQTKELTGKSLDWALAVALELEPEMSRPNPYDGSIAVLALPLPNGYPNRYKGGFFHTDPATCMACFGFEVGQVSELFADSDLCCYVARGYSAIYTLEMVHGSGDTPEQAVARCVVQMRLGDEVEVPDELCGVQL
jgi:hypothetical protein